MKGITVPTTTVMTPSFPTFSIALASSSPISCSPFAEIVATYFLHIGIFQLQLINSKTRINDTYKVEVILNQASLIDNICET